MKSRLKYPLFMALCFGGVVNVGAQSPITFFEGRWLGEMRIESPGLPENQVTKVPVEMLIAKTDTPGVWLWITEYKGSFAIEKKYRLKTRDEGKGLYETDEGNGIVLPMQLIGNRLYSRFEVMNNLLSSCYTLDGETLQFEIISGKGDPYTSTGGNSKEIPEVKGFSISSVQRSVLRRLK